MPAAHKVPENHPVHAFFSKYDPKAEIYVTHIDSTNASARKQHFVMLVGINLVWSALLSRRLYRGMYRYGVWFLVGKLAPRWNATAPDFNVALLGHILLDIFVFLILVPIIRDFVGGVAILRFHHGFPQKEIIFRKPSASTVANIVSEAPEKRDAFLKDLLRRAVDPEEMKHAAFGLPWEEWIYDYRAMAAACELNEKKVIDAKTWELCVWMKMKDGWTAVEQGKEGDIQNQIGMMDKMKVRLHAMGKIHVFHQMMEVIQVKTMSKDGTPLPVTEDVDAIVADIFKRNEVDFEKLTNELAKDAPPSARFASSSKKLD
ncbi:hypothetical protein L210DRAFT_3504819 [Boletus edulis BED1]|uniref:Uncharacterized protein n=1 Tax=Boletus edulis BED1 TaxID=1328754 RepID=A0AAD4GDE8_BOLED|nr:hypothetical protein L210DRAFT_3504819 [Boletus edulis BED1]